MSGEVVLFDGVIVGFESPPGTSKPALYVQGSVNGESAGFYLLVSEDMRGEYMRLGVGQMISGKARIVSRDPLILELVEGG